MPTKTDSVIISSIINMPTKTDTVLS